MTLVLTVDLWKPISFLHRAQVEIHHCWCCCRCRRCCPTKETRTMQCWWALVNWQSLFRLLEPIDDRCDEKWQHCVENEPELHWERTWMEEKFWKGFFLFDFRMLLHSIVIQIHSLRCVSIAFVFQSFFVQNSVAFFQFSIFFLFQLLEKRRSEELK